MPEAPRSSSVWCWSRRAIRSRTTPTWRRSAERVTAARALMDHPQHRRHRLRGRARLPLYLRHTALSLTRRLPDRSSSGSWAPTTLATSTAGSAGEDIARLVPMAVYARPGSAFRATVSRAAVALKPCPHPEKPRQKRWPTARRRPGFICTASCRGMSSTAIRAGPPDGSNDGRSLANRHTEAHIMRM